MTSELHQLSALKGMENDHTSLSGAIPDFFGHMTTLQNL